MYQLFFLGYIPWSRECCKLMRMYTIMYGKKPLPRTRETRDGWPLPTVETETEVNRDSRSKNERVLPWLVLGSLCQYKQFLPCLGCCSQPSTKYIFPHSTLHYISVQLLPSPSTQYTILYFSSIVAIAQQAGQASRAVSPVS